MVERPEADLASRIVWFDAFVSNVDRTVRNTNMLMWHRRLWLIDHGASLYFHHAPGWAADRERARDPFPLVKQHVLLPLAGALDEADAELAGRLTPDVIAGDRRAGPGRLAAGLEPAGARPRGVRALPADRLAAPRAFVEEARACPLTTRTTTRSSAWCRASSAARRSTSA